MGDGDQRRDAVGRGSSGSTDDTETAVVDAAPLDAAAAVGSAVGRYVVLEEVGRGAMGRVQRAYDPKLQREVALKEVAARSRRGSARLVAEARAMAQLSHPNVVAVYDVEDTARDHVVIVMEYVAGQTLRQWLDAAQPDWRDVLQRFVAAGRGLAAAHAAGLLHRDFKPANVLVGERGETKVTDFGLAEIVGVGSGSGDASGAATGPGDDPSPATTILGTPRYMAPEQHDGEPLTAAADQYALCVALWEALSGQPPFSGDDAVRAKHDGPPPFPARGVPARIVRAIERGLSPAPSDRWATVGELLDALARDPSRRRNRTIAAVIGTGLVVTAGLGLRDWVTDQAARCSGAELQLAGAWDATRRAAVEASLTGLDVPFADEAWSRTAAALDAYAEAWATMHTDSCTATTIRGEQSAAVMDLRMGCLHRAKVELEAITAQLATADVEVAGRAHELVAGLPVLSRCEDVDALAADVEPPMPEQAAAVEAIRAHLAGARAAVSAARYDDAAAHVAEARAALDGVDYGPLAAEVGLVEGNVLSVRGDWEQATVVFREALAHAARRRQWRPMGELALRLLYVVGYRLQRFDEGLSYRELAEGLARGDPRAEANVTRALSSVLEAKGDFAESEVLARRAVEILVGVYGEDDPAVATARESLSDAMFARGHYAQAEAESRRVLEIRLAAFGPDHTAVAATRMGLSATLLTLGRPQEAEREIRGALAIWAAVLAPDHPVMATAHANLAACLAAAGDLAAAEAEFRDALEILEARLGPDHPDTASLHNNLASIKAERGKYDEAETEFRRAIALWERTLGPGHPDVATGYNNLAAILVLRGDDEAALAAIDAAVAGWAEAHEAGNPDLVEARRARADILVRLGRCDAALADATAAWPYRDNPDVAATTRASLAFAYAQAQWDCAATQADRARAIELAQASLQAYAGLPEEPQYAPSIHEWLAQRRPG